MLLHSQVTVVVELIVAGQSDEAAPARRQREEDLDGCVLPHLGGSPRVCVKGDYVYNGTCGTKFAQNHNSSSISA